MKISTTWHMVMLDILIAVMLGIGMALPFESARAATCTVSNNDDSGTGSLRAMISDPACAVINFNADFMILLGSTLNITQNVEIDGNGHTVSISGQNSCRDFIISPDVTTSLKDLWIGHGSAPGQFGGGILNYGTLTIVNSTFYGNTAGWGGAIWNYSSLTVTGSTFDSNLTPGGDGAGINNRGSMTVTSSTFTNNSSGWYGAAIYDNAAIATVADSTFTSNSAGTVTWGWGVGGAIYNHNSSSLTLDNNTFSGNSNRGAADIYNNLSTLNYANNILTGSLAGPDCYNNYVIGTNTHNLVEDGSCSATWSGNPQLDGLADNGGPTQTMALLSGSPAIDVGDAAVCAAFPVGGKDQRGVSRPQGAGCDLGAYEYGPIIPVVTSSTPSAGAAVVDLGSLSVTFNQDMLVDGSLEAVNNRANYLLVEQGANGKFDTLSCKGGKQGDDILTSISHVTYKESTKTALLDLAGLLAGGSYRLFICGTTSIWSAAGLELNNGANDTQVDFMVNPSVIPSTGFASGRVTALGSRAIPYAALGSLWLEIPSLGIQATIVGVPPSLDGRWDISWLGDDAGWLNGTAYPTWAGNSVLTGHVYNANGQPGPFLSIGTLGWDDPVIVHAGSLQYIYKVREVMLVSPTDTAAMLKHEDLPWITLVSCRGYDQASGAYKYRILVRAVLTDVK